ncbi:MAG: BON domain-containing protein [Planctomycetales bacterium]
MRLSINRRSWITALALCLALPASASAQSQSLFGNRGPQSQIGSNLRGSAAGAGSLGAMGSMGGGMTAGGLGGGMAGFGGGATGFGSTGMGMTGMTTAGTTGGFIGANDPSRFVGNQQVGQQGAQFGRAGMQGGLGTQFGRTGTQGAMGTQFGRTGMQGGLGMQGAAGTRQQFGAAGAGAAFGAQGTQPAQGRAGQGRAGQGQNAAAPIRPRHEIAFTYPQLEAAAVRSSLDARFDKISQKQVTLSGVNVAATEQPGVVALRGEVASPEASRLAAIMARLEPGVRAVRNELTVRGQSPSP